METDAPLVEFEDTNPYETRDKFIKLIVGTAAGFIAGRLAENLYETIVKKHRANRL